MVPIAKFVCHVFPIHGRLYSCESRQQCCLFAYLRGYSLLANVCWWFFCSWLLVFGSFSNYIFDNLTVRMPGCYRRTLKQFSANKHAVRVALGAAWQSLCFSCVHYKGCILFLGVELYRLQRAKIEQLFGKRCSLLANTCLVSWLMTCPIFVFSRFLLSFSVRYLNRIGINVVILNPLFHLHRFSAPMLVRHPRVQPRSTHCQQYEVIVCAAV